MLWETHPDSKILGFAKRFGRNRVKADGAVCMLLKSKFGCCCGVPASNLSYCDVNVGGDGRPPFDSLVSLSSHFRIANKHSPRWNIYGSFAKMWALDIMDHLRKCDPKIFGRCGREELVGLIKIGQ